MFPALQAERQLFAIEAAAVPHMKQESRAAVIGGWARRARDQKRRSAAEALASLPIPVEHVPAPGSEAKNPGDGGGV